MPQVGGTEVRLEGIGLGQAEFWEGWDGKENFIETEEKITKSKGTQAGVTLGISSIDVVNESAEFTRGGNGHRIRKWTGSRWEVVRVLWMTVLRCL